MFSNPEDTKLSVLASNTQKRSNSKQAAALRDTTGRTYVAINIDTPSLKLSALDAVFTVAMASGITGIEAVVAVGQAPESVGALREFSPTAAVYFISESSSVSTL